MAQVTIYGIKNCDTMKKARAWLEQRGVAHAFHDYKTAGIDAAKLQAWAKEAGWDVLINRAGTTFRKLPEAAALAAPPRRNPRTPYRTPPTRIASPRQSSLSTPCTGTGAKRRGS